MSNDFQSIFEPRQSVRRYEQLQIVNECEWTLNINEKKSPEYKELYALGM